VRTLLEAAPRGTYQGLIPVDFAGRAVNMEVFRQLAKEYGLWIIEDACHAPGGYFTDSSGRRQNCGNGEYADLAIFSFHPVKHIATGEGGMITTNNPILYQKLLKLRTHGITRNADEFSNSLLFASGDTEIVNSLEPSQWPGWYMEMQDLGFNYRLTDFQAALGISQLKRAEEGIKRRKEIALKYKKAFESKPWLLGQSGEIEGHAYHLYILEVENRLALYNYLRVNHIYAQIHYIPCHLMPYYRQFGWKEGDMPHSERYYANCISLPMYTTLTVQEQEYVIETIKKFYA
ncbi:MAG: DegT/DnrJ/EryC1/StrS family aminotransferase, partial [Bacteroidota bacterium]|nr:DegT/DnrJ/EryC1/StrS family aminotransferase [Bacteroidota bacterium]